MKLNHKSNPNGCIKVNSRSNNESKIESIKSMPTNVFNSQMQTTCWSISFDRILNKFQSVTPYCRHTHTHAHNQTFNHQYRQSPPLSLSTSPINNHLQHNSRYCRCAKFALVVCSFVFQLINKLTLYKCIPCIHYSIKVICLNATRQQYICYSFIQTEWICMRCVCCCYQINLMGHSLWYLFDLSTINYIVYSV